MFAPIPKEKILLSGTILINVLSPKFRLCLKLRRKTIELSNTLTAVPQELVRQRSQE